MTFRNLVINFPENLISNLLTLIILVFVFLVNAKICTKLCFAQIFCLLLTTSPYLRAVIVQIHYIFLTLCNTFNNQNGLLEFYGNAYSSSMLSKSQCLSIISKSFSDNELLSMRSGRFLSVVKRLCS